jgi:hypothetical protein
LIPTTRLPNESPPAYEAWLTFLQLGDERTTEAVAKRLSKSEQIIRRWSARHKWQQRLITWHHEEAQRQTDAKAKAALESARLVEKRRQQVADRAWDMAQKLFEKAQQMLAYPLSQQEKKDGENTYIINPAGWSFGTASKIIETSDALARLALGMPQKVTALTDKDGGTLGAVAPPVQLVVNVTRDPDDPVRSIIASARTSFNGEGAADERP